MLVQYLKKRLSYIFLALFFAILISDTYIAINNQKTVSASHQLIEDTYKALNEANNVLLLAKDLQNISRGFILTSDSTYLTDLKEAQQAIYQHYYKLSSLISNIPAQQQRVHSLRALIDERLDITKHNIELKNKQGINAASAYVASGIGRRNIGKIGQLITAIEGEENRLLNIRKQDNTESIQQIERLFYFILCFALLIGIIEFSLLIRNDKLRRQIAAQAKEIANKANRFEKLLEYNFEGIVVLDQHLRYTYKSRFAEEITGYSAAERDAHTGIRQIHPQDKQLFILTLQEVKAHPGKTRELYYRILHKGGHYLWIQSFITNRLDEKEVAGIVFNFRDVTLKMEMDQQKDSFLNMVSHELKTPVTSLKVITYLLSEQFKLDKDFDKLEYLQKMINQTDRLTRLINDLLDLNKVSDIQFLYNHTVFEFIQLAEDVISDMQRLTATHRIHFINDQIVNGAMIMGDKDRIAQVLTNLLSNAVKYSPDATEVVVSVTEQDDEVICSVEDFGIGIDANEHHQVFERFFRTKKSIANLFPGLGIGLYISAQFVKAHRGRIWIESKDTGGTIFRFSLPLYNYILQPGGAVQLDVEDR